MKGRPALLLVILIYLTLDLSLPTMPGAFVFEAADSVESTQIRTRAAVEIVSPPALRHPPGFVPFRPPLGAKERLAPASLAECPARPVVSWRSQAPYDSAPPSEDPH